MIVNMVRVVSMMKKSGIRMVIMFLILFLRLCEMI